MGLLPGGVVAAACRGLRRRPSRRRGASGASLGDLLAPLLAAAGEQDAAPWLRVTSVELKVPAELRFKPPAGADARAGGRGWVTLRTLSLRRHRGSPPVRPLEIVLEAFGGRSEPDAATEPPMDQEQ